MDESIESLLADIDLGIGTADFADTEIAERALGKLREILAARTSTPVAPPTDPDDEREGETK